MKNLFYFSLLPLFILSQNTIQFDLTYNDYSGAINGNPGEVITIPMEGIFYQPEGSCGGVQDLCAAFIISSLDPVIDIDYTIREKASIQFNDYTINNDFISKLIVS